MRTLQLLIAATVAFTLSGCVTGDDIDAVVTGPASTQAAPAEDPSADQTLSTSPPRRSDGPAVGDHWHSAYQVVVCGEILPPLPEDVEDNRTGVHTHGDGLIHIHPFIPSGAGPNATLGTFFEESEWLLTDSALRTPNADIDEADATCDGEPARLVVLKWTDLAVDRADVIEVGLADVPLDQGDPTLGQLITIALVPQSRTATALATDNEDLRPDSTFLENYVIVPPRAVPA